MCSAIAAAVSGCGAALNAGPATAHSAQNAPLAPVSVSEADFGRRAGELLVTGDAKPERTNLLVGVVRRQLARAQQRFESEQPQAGLDAVIGAFYLVRAGEFVTPMLDGSAAPLGAAAAEVSRLGSEGRAFAIYRMLEQVVPAGKARDDVEQHLHAMAEFSRATSNDGPMQVTGRDRRAAVDRALLWPTSESMTQAEQSVVGWIRHGLDVSLAEPMHDDSERSEAVEAFRAQRSGGTILLGLYLRQSDPQGALEALEREDLARIVPPSLLDRFDRAAGADYRAWDDLYRIYSAEREVERPELGLDPELADAAAWGAAVGLYRSRPNSLAASAPLARELITHGMSEAAPFVLAGGVSDQSDAEELSHALELVENAILTESNAGQLQSARRCFDNAAKILELAEAKKFNHRLRPSAAQLHYLMGSLEMESGELGRAKPHMEYAVREEPSFDAYSRLAAIDRQQGDAKASLAALDRSIQLAEASGDAASEAESLLAEFEIHRDRNESEPAKQALAAALNHALDARKLASTDSVRARAERLLAQVLERYGDVRGAKRATERAYDAARANQGQLRATILDAASRALTRGDLDAARDAVRRAIDASLSDEDLVYPALWLQLLEKKLRVPSDGTAEEAFSAVEESSGWPAKLRAWARGKLNDQELVAAARDRAQQTEAAFYVAMANNGFESPKLKQIAESPVDLMEVGIARDLVAQGKPPVAVQLPPDVALP